MTKCQGRLRFVVSNLHNVLLVQLFWDQYDLDWEDIRYLHENRTAYKINLWDQLYVRQNVHTSDFSKHVSARHRQRDENDPLNGKWGTTVTHLHTP